MVRAPRAGSFLCACARCAWMCVCLSLPVSLVCTPRFVAAHLWFCSVFSLPWEGYSFAFVLVPALLCEMLRSPSIPLLLVCCLSIALS